MSHPSSLDLEAFACGDDVAAVAAHVSACDACRAFVERARGFVKERGPTRLAADAAVARAARASRRSALVGVSAVAAPLAAAALLFLVLRTPSRDPSSPNISPTATNASTGAPSDIAFKGKIQLAVVRERGGEQARFTNVVTIRPGDRLRVEVALDREQAILGGVLEDDAGYLELLPSGVRGPGTHYSERSAKVDDKPTRGTIVVGSPEAVERARATKRMDGVATLLIELEDAW
jgi:hypothetical protein